MRLRLRHRERRPGVRAGTRFIGCLLAILGARGVKFVYFETTGKRGSDDFWFGAKGSLIYDTRSLRGRAPGLEGDTWPHSLSFALDTASHALRLALHA